MVDLYTAICVQANRSAISHRSEIKEKNLNRALELIDYGFTWMDYQIYAPVKLIVFPEVFMQGWIKSAGKHDNIWHRVSKDIAIEIPGEETEMLAEKARKYNVYIAGGAHERVPELGDDYPLNCVFIISPEGKVIYKHHKFCTYLTYVWFDDISPHDIWDKYIKAFDGKYGRKAGDIVSCFFPVVETDIGKLGYIICNEGFYSEHSRALGIQGCEVMLRSSGVLEPEGSPPQQSWEITNRAAAFYNMMYVVACGPGDYLMESSPRHSTPGQSMIIDFQGAFLQHVTYPGETVTGAVINIEQLRKRRMDPKHNWIPQLRTELYREIYKKSMYPINLYEKRLPETQKERLYESPEQKLVKEGNLIPPAK